MKILGHYSEHIVNPINYLLEPEFLEGALLLGAGELLGILREGATEGALEGAERLGCTF